MTEFRFFGQDEGTSVNGIKRYPYRATVFGLPKMRTLTIWQGKQAVATANYCRTTHPLITLRHDEPIPATKFGAMLEMVSGIAHADFEGQLQPEDFYCEEHFKQWYADLT